MEDRRDGLGLRQVKELGLCQCGCGGRTSIIKRNRTAKGHVAGEPRKYIWGHSRIGSGDPNPYRIDAVTGCWLWTQSLSRNGYGIKQLRNPRMTEQAHTYMYKRCVGPIPDGCELDHLCRVRSCVNPDHLEPVSHAVNVRRGRATKLSVSQVIEIKKMISSKVPGKSIAALYGVDKRTISNIKCGTGWVGV